MSSGVLPNSYSFENNGNPFIQGDPNETFAMKAIKGLSLGFGLGGLGLGAAGAAGYGPAAVGGAGSAAAGAAWPAADLAAMDALAGGGGAAVGDAAIAGGAGIDAMTGRYDWMTDPTLAGGGEVGSGYPAASTAGAGAAAAAGSKSALGRIINGTATMDDYLEVGGRAAPALLGAFGSKQQANSLQAQADRFATYGGPSRARYEASMSPGFDPMSIPGYAGAVDTASKGVLARLSASGGNPFGNPGGLIDAQKQVIAGTALPAIQNYQNLNSGTGFGSTLGASGQFGAQAIGAEGGIWNAAGAGVNDVLNPPKSLAEQLTEYEKMKKSFSGGPSLD